MLKNIEAHQDEEAWKIAGIKDDHINPILAEQYKVLNWARDQIVNTALDAKRFQAKIDEIEARKNLVRKELGWL